MCSIGYDYGTCGECNYTVEDLVKDHPNGTSDAEATARLIHVGDQYFLIVIPHRPTCSLHTNQKECFA
jgi:hypothetical protein